MSQKLMTDHGEIIELIPAYALHALDEDEARRVAAHLESCALCRAELAAYEVVADRMADAVSLTEPPGHLKDRLMARVGAGVESAPPVEHRPSWWERLQATMRASAPVWAPASAVLILALLVSNILLWRQVSQSPGPEVVTVALVGTDDAPGANGVLAFTPGQPEGVLVVSDLTPLPAEQQYQLWLIDDTGNRDSGAVFSVDPAGRARVDVSGGKALPAYVAFGVTVEPAGGSPGPTGQQVLGSDL